MKFLILGYGSIGKRHADSILRVDPSSQISIFREGGKSRAQSPYSLSSGVTVLDTFEKVKSFKPDCIFICSPTEHHRSAIETWGEIANALFVEKPIAALTEDLDALDRWFEQHSKLFFYGTVLRYHPVIQKLKEICRDQKLGAPRSYQFYSQSFLPDWRPHSDYRMLYSAGPQGGVTLDLIHEFDFAEFLFGQMTRITGLRKRSGQLEIQADDQSNSHCFHPCGIEGQIALDCITKTPRRGGIIDCERGQIKFDLMANQIEFQGKTLKFHVTPDDLYDGQTRTVLASLKRGESGDQNAKNAIELVRKIQKGVLFEKP